jgi:alkanesulfonate monooxygenase SsuD/methylene tetrahydromethanopterin reductase-like flavin-dependent oxidoreductase (luciferase family)
VYWQLHHEVLRQWWEDYATRYEDAHGTELAPGDNRMLVLNVRIADTHEQAMSSARAGHDEFWKFLGPYGWSKGYLMDDGSPAPAGLIPTLEQSMAQKTWLVGTADEVAEGINFYKDTIGLERLTIFPHFPGDTYDLTEDQLHRFDEDVRPLI